VAKASLTRVSTIQTVDDQLGVGTANNRELALGSHWVNNKVRAIGPRGTVLPRFFAWRIIRLRWQLQAREKAMISTTRGERDIAAVLPRYRAGYAEAEPDAAGSRVA
jgi:hypothetical protein